MSTSTDPRPSRAAERSRGRPREGRVDAAVSQAVAELLAEVGYDALTIEGVASRAGVAKTTLYRRWFTKTQLVIGSLHVSDFALTPAADTGSLKDDLFAHVHAASEALSAPIGQAVIGLVSAARRHPELAEALRKKFSATRRAELDEILTRAESRGELAPGVDRQVLIDLIISPLWYRALLWGQYPSREHLASLINILVAGCSTRGRDSAVPTDGCRTNGLPERSVGDPRAIADDGRDKSGRGSALRRS